MHSSRQTNKKLEEENKELQKEKEYQTKTIQDKGNRIKYLQKSSLQTTKTKPKTETSNNK